jgi:hypothetical protein
MKQFQIYGFINNRPLLITDSSAINGAATFDETFSLKENMKSSLSFKISDTLPSGEANPFIGLVYPEGKLRLVFEDYDSPFDFIIKSKTPEFYKDVIFYSINAEDYASNIFAKEGQGLTLSKTGTIRELAYEVLVQSRKNLGYTNLTKNFLNFNEYYDKTTESEVTESLSFNYTFAAAGSAYITFPRTKDLVVYNYNLSFNLLDVPNGGVECNIIELDNNGSYITTHSYSPQVFLVGNVSLNFTPRKGMGYYKVEFVGIGTGILSAVDWKLKLDQTQFDSIIDDTLKLSPLFNDEDFKGELGDESYFKKVTVDLSNSNLYNGLVEIAKIFKAELIFDYINHTVNFINKEKTYRYRGVRFSPDFNLSGLNRTEETNEYYSVLNISGSGSVYSIFPTTPPEFAQFFHQQVDNDFADFDNYNTTKYADVVSNALVFSSSLDSLPERLKVLTDYAIAADRVPNLENRLYSLDYFEKTNKITSQKLTTFKNIINNDLRKLNIKLRIYSELFQKAYSLFSSKESEIEFLSRNITVELLSQKAILLKLIEEEVNSTSWLAYTNQYNASIEQMNIYKAEIMQAYGIVFDLISLEPQYLEYEPVGTGFKLTENSYTSLILNLYGYYNIYQNGVKQKLDEVTKTIKELANTKARQEAELVIVNEKLADLNITSYNKREFEVQKSGLESQLKASAFMIGEYTTDVFNPIIPGLYQTQKYYLETIYRFLGNYVYRASIIDYEPWVAGQDLNSTYTWSSTGNATVVLEGNKDFAALGQTDIMVKLQNYSEPGTSAAIATTHNSLTPGSNYKLTGLFKVPANTEGVVTIALDITDLPSMNITLAATLAERWIGYEFYPTGGVSKAYTFPEYIEINPINITVTTGTIPTLNTYHVTYSFEGTGNEYVFLYRPRLDLTSNSLYDVEDIFNLYDNPLMVNYEEDFKVDFNYIEGLYDLLYNQNYPANVTKAKNILLSNLYKDYEQYISEGRYENSDEITTDGLMEQALLAFETIKYPKITYSMSIIDLSALDDYKFLRIRVGDKIKIQEEFDRLYLSYQNEDTNYLQITEISHNLRSPESTSIGVSQDDETTKILQYILKATQ